jgi:hypothetical protein
MIISHEFIKVANIQLGVSINTGVTEETLDDLVLNKGEIIAKVETVFHALTNEEPNFIVFPEYSFFKELEDTYLLQSRKLNSIIISGSYISNELIPEVKIFQPNGNVDIIQKSELAYDEYLFPNISLNTGDLPSVYSYTSETGREIRFLVLICYDFYSRYYKFFDENIDFLFISAYNKNFDRFYSQLNEFCFKTPSFSIYSNVAEKKAGNSAVFGIHDSDIHDRNILNNNICDNKEEYSNLIANFDETENGLMIVEVDINRPFLIRPKSITRNNIPNVKSIKKIKL